MLDPFGVTRSRDASTSVEPGDSVLPVFDLEIGEDHIARKVQVGIHDLYEEIQSWRDSCGVEAALKLLSSGRADPYLFADKGSNRGAPTESLDMSEDFVSASMKAKAAEASSLKSRAALDRLGFDSGRINDSDYVKSFLLDVEKRVADAGGKTE